MTKTVIYHRFRLENYFQENLYMIDVWVHNGSGWNVESIESQYINISTFRPLAGIFLMDLPADLRSPRKYFLWCHVRHINPSKEHPERIKKN